MILWNSIWIKHEKKQSHDLHKITQVIKNQVKDKQNIGIKNFFGKFTNIFTPLIPGFIASGLLLGFATILEQIILLNNYHIAFLDNLISYMKVFSKGLFSFLAIMIGYNTQQSFWRIWC